MSQEVTMLFENDNFGFNLLEVYGIVAELMTCNSFTMCISDCVYWWILHLQAYHNICIIRL